MQNKFEQALSVLTGPRGLLGQMVKIPNYIKPLDFYIYTMVYALYSGKDKKNFASTNHLSISGAGFTDKDARLRCLGEAVERFCWYYAFYWKKLLYTSYKKLNKLAVAPREFFLFSERQYRIKGFPFQHFTEDLKIYWIKGICLTDKKEVFVPAQLCLGYTQDASKICFSTTTGVSAGRDYYFCLYNSLCEVVERDAFIITWLNKIAPREIEVKWDFIFPGLEDKLKVSNYKLNVYLLPTDVNNIYPVLAVNVNRNYETPFLSIGACCRTSFLGAIKKAVLESFHCLNYLFDCEIKGIKINDWRMIFNFDDHALYYSTPDVGRRASFLFPRNCNSKVKMDGKFRILSIKDSVQNIISNIKKLGYKVIVIDLAPEEIKEMGFHVIKVLIPGLVDLGLRNFYYLGSKRIYEIPRKRGLNPKRKNFLNTFPHPFP